MTETPQQQPTPKPPPDHPHPPVQVVDSRMGAVLYNPFLWAGEKLGMARLRRGLLAEARGKVLEIGAGTGLNLRHYPTDLEELVLAEVRELIGPHVELEILHQDIGLENRFEGPLVEAMVGALQKADPGAPVEFPASGEFVVKPSVGR